MNKLSKLTVALALLAGLVGHSAAQEGCNDAKCKTDTVILNTGYNQASGSLYSPGQSDGSWELVDAPNTSLTLPTPAWAIAAISAWATLPNSGWISAFNNSSQNQNNDPPLKPYSFQRCFCTCEGVKSIDINLQMLIDNYGDVYFDNTLIGSQTNTTVASFHNPPFIVHPAPIPVSPGKHCIRIDLRNNSGVAMGVDIVGTVKSASPAGAAAFLSPACCDSTPSPSASPSASPTATATATPVATPCAQVVAKEVRCEPNGGYSYTFTVTNSSGSDISQILLSPVSGSTFSLSPQLVNLSTPLHNGQSTTQSVNLSNVKPGDKVCFFVTLMSDKTACCTVQVCPTLPVCGIR